MTEPLQQIADHLRVMPASATELHDGIGDVTGYQIKTGALHRILGVLSGVGHPVAVPLIPNKTLSLLDGRATVAHVVVTDAGWAQLWVHGVVIQSGYGQGAKERCDKLAERINANASGAAEAGDRCPSCGIRYGYHLASCAALAPGMSEAPSS